MHLCEVNANILTIITAIVIGPVFDYHYFYRPIVFYHYFVVVIDQVACCRYVVLQ